MDLKIRSTIIKIVKGNIIEQKVDAIVNAANSTLMGGLGVDGAIHAAGGPVILEECKQIINKIGMLPTGDAVLTQGGELPSKHVIHTVGPIWKDGKESEDQQLRNAYWNSLLLAKEKGVKTIAFPAISTGAYGFPKERGATVAIQTVKEFISLHDHFKEIRFVLFSKPDFDLFQRLLFK